MIYLDQQQLEVDYSHLHIKISAPVALDHWNLPAIDLHISQFQPRQLIYLNFFHQRWQITYYFSNKLIIKEMQESDIG